MSRGSTLSTGSEFMKIGPRLGSRLISGSRPPRPSAIGVSTPVGCTVLTRMLCRASSLAMLLAMPTTPCLAATYGAVQGSPLMPAVELVQMIEPPPAAIRCGTLTTMVFQTPVRLVSRVSCQTCGGHLVPALDGADARVGADDVQPAELGHPAVDRGLQGGGVPHVD